MRKTIYITTALILLYLFFSKPQSLTNAVNHLSHTFSDYWQSLTKPESKQ